MALDERRERPCPARPAHASEQRLLAVAEVFDILHVEVMRLGFEDCGGHGQPSFARFAGYSRTTPAAATMVAELLQNCERHNAQAYASSRAALSFAIANARQDRKSTRLNSSHLGISYAVFC